MSLHEYYEDCIAPLFYSLLLSLMVLQRNGLKYYACSHSRSTCFAHKIGKRDKSVFRKTWNTIDSIDLIPFSAKFGGAVGIQCSSYCLSRHWLGCFCRFLCQWYTWFRRSQTTTQIEHYDNLAAFFDAMKRINTILIDFNRDNVDLYFDGLF